MQDVAPSSCFVQVLKSSTSPNENLFLDFRQLALNANSNIRNLPKPTKKDIADIESSTRLQAANTLWHLCRNGRITASIFHEINVKAKKLLRNENVTFANTVDKIFGCGPNLSHLPAVRYGVEMKHHAKRKYEEIVKATHHKAISISECGLFLHPEFPYLAATPDLVSQCSCCDLGVVEIKCSHSIAESRPAIGLPPYLLQNSSGNMTLNRNHSHYTQIQGQMEVLNAKWGHFFVFSNHGWFLEKIERNDKFLHGLFENFEAFFVEHVLPCFESR